MDTPVTFKFVSTGLIVLTYSIVVICSAILCYQIKKIVLPFFAARKFTGLSIFFYELRYAAMLLFAICIFIYLPCHYFSGIEIRQGVLTLDYCWPCPDLILTDDQNIGVKIEPYRRGKRVIIVVSVNGRSYKSESVFQEKADEVVKAISSKMKVQYE